MTVPAVPDLDTIRRRAEAAAPGPWSWRDPGGKYKSALFDGRGGVCVLAGNADVYPSVQDAEFIAHARTDVPALIAALVAVEAERDTLAAKIEAVRAMTRHGPFRTAELGHQHEWLHTADINATLDFVDADVSVVPGGREREG